MGKGHTWKDLKAIPTPKKAFANVVRNGSFSEVSGSYKRRFIRTKLFSGGGFYLCRAMPGGISVHGHADENIPDGWESVKDFNFDKPSRSSIPWIEKVGIGKSFSEHAKRFACRLRTKTQAL